MQSIELDEGNSEDVPHVGGLALVPATVFDVPADLDPLECD